MSFLLLMILALFADGLMDELGPLGFLAVGAVVVAAAAVAAAVRGGAEHAVYRGRTGRNGKGRR